MASTKEQIVLRGVAASPGVAHGPAFVFMKSEVEVTSYSIPESHIESEKNRFERAIYQTRRQILDLRDQVASRLGEEEAAIFDAHLLVLEDKALIEETLAEMEESLLNIDYCFYVVSSRYIDAFRNIDDEFIRERVADIEDVTRRLLNALLGESEESVNRLVGERVIVSRDLSPSDTAGLEKGNVMGIVTQGGSRTSHAVIVARSIEVPAVVGLREALATIKTEDEVLVDGYDGMVIINPTEQTLFRYGRLRVQRQHLRELYEQSIGLPTKTTDGTTFALVANVEGLDDAKRARDKGAEGIGLFRTESIFIRHDKFPSEDEQFEIYRDVARTMAPQPVTIRTLDLGGDKNLAGGAFHHHEDNPFMGFRAIRFCLEHVGLFKDQLRAILRASAYGNIKIMYPMIAATDELIEANAILDECKTELSKRGLPFAENIPVGSMIEIPSAAATVDLLAKHCSFFSIGTNDLIQYLLAVDRLNERVAHLYQPAHPAVLRTIRGVIDVAHQHRCTVSICGEMAGDPAFALLLFGMGADELSVGPGALAEIKYLVRRMDLGDAQNVARSVLESSDTDRTLTMLDRFKKALASDADLSISTEIDEA